MAQLTTTEKLLNGKNLSDSKIKRITRLVIHPLLLMAAKSKIKYKINKENSLNLKSPIFVGERPIIFACNHTNSFDSPIAFNAIKKHTYLFAGKQPLEKMDEIFFNLNGTIFVDRKDKEDMGNSKEAMIELLKQKRNLLVFPEGTWNLTDEKLMHEMKWGIIDVAKKSNALIVPMALDYEEDNNICRYKFDEPIDVNNLPLKEGINLVRDKMASLRWELFELRGTFKRKNIDVEHERRIIEERLKKYPKLDIEYEKSVIFKPHDDAKDVLESRKTRE